MIKKMFSFHFFSDFIMKFMVQISPISNNRDRKEWTKKRVDECDPIKIGIHPT